SYQLAAGGREGIVRTFTVIVDDKSRNGFVAHSNVTFPQASEIFGLEFSADGKVLGCARQRGAVSLLDPATGKSVRELAGDRDGENAAFSIAFHPTRPWCLTAHKENVARLWDTR